MIQLAIIVGINTDAISEENFPEWLLDIPDNLFNLSKEKWDKDYYGLSSDIGIAYYLYKKSKTPYYKRKFTLTILTKDDIKLNIFNKYDFIIGLYDPYYYSIDTNSSNNYKKYNSIIKNTTATFYQPLQLQKFILNKKLYIETLKQNGFPVLDTMYIKIQTNMNITNIINKINKQCNQWNTTFFITKPQPGGFGIGFKKWDINKVISNHKSFKQYLMKIQKLPKIEESYLLVQNFVYDFEHFYEVRTYWLNGKYSHSLGTIIDPISLGKEGFEKVTYAYPENEYPDDSIIKYMDTIPEVIDMKLIKKLKKIGNKVFTILPDHNPFLLRIDFGCCLQNKHICRDYFINEIEYLPNIFPEYNQHVDIMKRIGDAILKNTL